MKIGAAYIRVSTDDQVELSPDSQKAEILEYAKRNKIVVPEEFIYVEGEKKKGLSGRKAANRPKFQEMIAMAKEKPKPFDCILLWKFSRFARNIDEATYYKSILRNKCGIDVISISEPIMEGMYGRLIEMIIEWSDEFYSFNLATEVKRGMSSKAKAGEYCAYAPMGYKMEDKKLVIDDEYAPVVRWIFEEYAAGGKVRSMIYKLNEQGIRTRFGNLLDNRFITYMVSNPLYKGEILFSMNGRRKRGEIPNEEGVIRQRGIHEAIVSEELWQVCYDRYLREKNLAHRESKRNEYALRTILKCGNCGTSLTYASSGRVQCSSYSRGTCRVSHSLDYDMAEREVIQQIRKDFMNGLFANDKKKKQVVDNSEAIKSLEKKLSKLDDAYFAGVYELPEYKRMRAELVNATEVLKEQEQASKQEQHQTKATARNIDKLLRSYDNMSALERNHVLMTYIDKIIAHKTPEGYNFEIFYR